MGNSDIEFSLPSPPLRRYITHYWLSRNNQDPYCAILPDGTIDLVFNIDEWGSISRVYGAVTQKIDYSLNLRSHYLGINFKPGQSRHFLAAAANEFTNYYEAADKALALSFHGIEDALSQGNVFQILDTALLQYLRRREPVTSRIDELLNALEASQGQLPLSECAALYGKSARQLQRDFANAIGVSVKLYAQIIRFHSASRAMFKGAQNLADLAASLGYSDQSHMNRDFRRFTELSPAAFSSSRAAFLQDRYFHFLETIEQQKI